MLAMGPLLIAARVLHGCLAIHSSVPVENLLAKSLKLMIVQDRRRAAAEIVLHLRLAKSGFAPNC